MTSLLRALLIGAGILFATVLFGFLTFFRDIKLKTAGMEPTLEVGDQLYMNYRTRQAQRGEVIVYQAHDDPNRVFISRVLAVGGERIELREDVFWIDGHPSAHRPLGDDRFGEALGGHSFTVIVDPGVGSHWMTETKIPEGQLFVIGDNRAAAKNSGGLIYASDVLGKVRYRLGPRKASRVD